jgi:hypothetical protein
MTRLTRLHRFLQRVLLPPAFRAEYGEELEATLEARLAGRDRWRASAVFGLELADLFRTACREWWWILMVPSESLGSRGRLLVEGSLSDLGLAVRSLSKAPTFTLVSAWTLAVAIAANAAIFSVVDAVLIDPLAFPSSDRLVAIAASAPGTDMPEEFGPAPEFYVQYREAADLLEDLGMFLFGQFTFRTEERVERLSMAQGLPSMFPKRTAVSRTPS